MGALERALVLPLLLLLAGCGGVTRHHIFVDGEHVGEGECRGNECTIAWGTPPLLAWTPGGDAVGPVLANGLDVMLLARSGAPHALVLDGRLVGDVRVMPDGTLWQAGSLIGYIPLDGAGNPLAPAQLSRTCGGPLRAARADDGGVRLGGHR